MTNLTINFENQTIEMTKAFAQKASKYGSDEYKLLQEARRDYPEYRPVSGVRKNTKKSANKSVYSKLTYSFMRQYIETHDDDDNSIMTEFLELRAKTTKAEEMLAEAESFQTIKKWFLKKYPAFEEYQKTRKANVNKINKTENPTEVVSIDGKVMTQIADIISNNEKISA